MPGRSPSRRRCVLRCSSPSASSSAASGTPWPCRPCAAPRPSTPPSRPGAGCAAATCCALARGRHRGLHLLHRLRHTHAPARGGPGRPAAPAALLRVVSRPRPASWLAPAGHLRLDVSWTRRASCICTRHGLADGGPRNETRPCPARDEARRWPCRGDQHGARRSRPRPRSSRRTTSCCRSQRVAIVLSTARAGHP